MDCRDGAYFPGVYRWAWYGVADHRVRFSPGGWSEEVTSGKFSPRRVATRRGDRAKRNRNGRRTDGRQGGPIWFRASDISGGRRRSRYDECRQGVPLSA
jgi:hypothetical protein